MVHMYIVNNIIYIMLMTKLRLFERLKKSKIKNQDEIKKNLTRED